MARIFNIINSSSSIDFVARNAAHFLSRLRNEALVSASSGVSTPAHRANSHRQSSRDRVLVSSAAFMRFLNIDTLATESNLKITDNNGESLELRSTEVLGLKFSTGGEALPTSAVNKDGWSLQFPRMEQSISIDLILAKFSKIISTGGWWEQHFSWRRTFDCQSWEVFALEPSKRDRDWNSDNK